MQVKTDVQANTRSCHGGTERGHYQDGSVFAVQTHKRFTTHVTNWSLVAPHSTSPFSGAGL